MVASSGVMGADTFCFLLLLPLVEGNCGPWAVVHGIADAEDPGNEWVCEGNIAEAVVATNDAVVVTVELLEGAAVVVAAAFVEIVPVGDDAGTNVRVVLDDWERLRLPSEAEVTTDGEAAKEGNETWGNAEVVAGISFGLKQVLACSL